ncbi:hypothetical protein GCM10010912_06290 [Paenibacillus albidus]|uniref:Uncharacterized protein n=1 Tax=Paenibacillus albidus TaxID=2041023 RepID=A0A917FD64_9BACL|nr:hypothetical protein [Paenibacillus albidus]GGF63973.1 hypothetical protein GCM10010912_06290 [Paenibacillus albidus]
MKLKKILAPILSLVIAVSFSTSAFAESPANVTNEDTRYHLEDSVFDENNEVIGTKITDTVVQTIDEAEGKKTILIEDIKYKFTENSEKYENVFRDEQKTTEILITDNGEYYLNDQKLSEEFLNAEILGTSDQVQARAVESGGYYWATHYTNSGQSSASIFYCEAYSDTNFFMDPGYATLPKVIMWQSPSPGLSDFKMYANNVASARANIDTGMAALGASGAAAITPIWIIGAIGVSASAYAVWSNSVAGHQQMTNAYNLLYNLGGTIIH